MKYIVSLIFVMLSVAVSADKYDDLVAKMNNQTPNVAFYNYQNYQKENPQMGNVYYQLAKISYDYLLQTNPLYDIEAFRYYAYNAKLYYGSCLHFATESDVRKYAEHYTGVDFPEKPNLEALSAYIRPKLKEIATITAAGNALSDAFVRLSSQYERCVQIFLALNTKFDSFNAALLQATADDEKALRQLQTISDSIPEYIAAYKKALGDYTIEGYAPTFEIVPIELFRIDALCSANFLVNNVVLYDFAAWVRQFETRRDTRVTPILSEAQKSYQKLMQTTDFQASVSLINSLYQLDPTSYIASVLQIRNAYNQVMTANKKIADAPDNDKRMAMLYDMSTAVKTAQEQHARLQTLTADDLQKYADFTARYFPKTMPYEALAQTVAETDSVYNSLLQNFRATVTPAVQSDPNVVTVNCGVNLQATLRYQPSSKRNQLTIESAGRALANTRVMVDEQPKAMFYLPDDDQLVLAHDVIDVTLAEWKTQLALYDIKSKQLNEWTVLPRVDNVACITTTENGYAVVVNEEKTKAVAFYLIDNNNQMTHQPVLAQAATVVSVAHYNSDTFVVFVIIEDKPQLLLVEKK